MSPKGPSPAPAPRSAPAPPPPPPLPAADRLRLVAAGALLVTLLLSLHAVIWSEPFLLDDYRFYDDAGRVTAQTVLLGSPSAGNYYRPLGREIYFALGRAAFGPNPNAFRVVNLALLLAILGGVMALAARFGGARAAILAGAAYACFGFHRVTLGWISGAQDLIATALGVLAALLYLAERTRAAGTMLFAGLFAKESIAALPLVMSAYGRWIGGALRRTLPLWLGAGAWLAVVVGVRAARGTWSAPGGGEASLGIADVALTPAHALEGLRLAFLGFVGMNETWSELAGAWSRFRPPLFALAIVVALALLAASAGAGRNERGLRGRGLKLALVWAVLGALPVAFVGHHFSAYYLTFAGVGTALGLGLLLARAHVAVAVTALAAFLTLHAVANGTRDYRISLEDPGPPGTPFVSAGRLEANGRLLNAYQAALRGAVHARGTDVVLYRMTRELAIASGVDRAPRIWLGDSTLTLTPQSQFTFAKDGRPRVFLRLDPERGRFAVLPDSLAFAMEAGEAAMERGETAAARDQLARALAWARPGEHDLERAELSNTFGVASAELGDTLQARRAWETTLSLEPDHVEARINLAMLDAQSGRLDSARGQLLDLLRAHPDERRARDALARVEQALRAPAP